MLRTWIEDVIGRLRQLGSHAVASLRPSALVLDGEAVCCDPDGTANFEGLHSRAHDYRVFLYAFDLLELGDLDLRPQPLEERRGRLQHLLRKVTAAGVQLNEHIEGDGAIIFAHPCKLGFEGIVSKHRAHPHRSGSSKAWVKVKNPNAPGVLRFQGRRGTVGESNGVFPSRLRNFVLRGSGSGTSHRPAGLNRTGFRPAQSPRQ